MRTYIIFLYRTIKSCNPLTTWFYRNRLPSALKTKIQCKMRPSGRIAQMRGSDQTMQYQNGWWCLCVEAMNPSQKNMSLCVVNGFSMILSIYCHPRCVTLLPNFPSPTLHPFFSNLLYSIFLHKLIVDPQNQPKINIKNIKIHIHTDAPSSTTNPSGNMFYFITVLYLLKCSRVGNFTVILRTVWQNPQPSFLEISCIQHGPSISIYTDRHINLMRIQQAQAPRRS